MLDKIITPLLALVIIGLTFGLWAVALFYPFTSDQKDVVLFVLGSLSTLSAGVVSYYFGSSSSSAQKNSTIEKMANNQAQEATDLEVKAPMGYKRHDTEVRHGE